MSLAFAARLLPRLADERTPPPILAPWAKDILKETAFSLQNTLEHHCLFLILYVYIHKQAVARRVAHFVAWLLDFHASGVGKLQRHPGLLMHPKATATMLQ